MDYLRFGCQSKQCIFFVFIFMMGCSSDLKKSKKIITTTSKSFWFDGPIRFNQKTLKGDIEDHAFFDLQNDPNKDNLNINYYLLTEAGSRYGRKLNLVSGKPVKEFNYCKQKDVWKKYSGDIDVPNFSIGLVPRLLDQTNQPQLIFVFGNQTYFETEHKDKLYSQRARVVGGVLLQYCEKYPCVTNEDWLSRLVLIAVNPADPEMKNIFHLSDLKNRVDWEYSVAFAQNGLGRTFRGLKEDPAYRLTGEVRADKAFEYAFSKGQNFTPNTILNFRNDCYGLYDHFWKEAQKLRLRMEKYEKNKDKMTARYWKRLQKLKSLTKYGLRNVKKDKSEIDKSTEAPEEYLNRPKLVEFFNRMDEKSKDRFLVCKKFVRASNLNHNPERHWFFSFVHNYYQLEELGYYFSCNRKTWIRNPLVNSGKRLFNTNKPKRCDDYREFERAFDRGINIMAGLANSQRDHYRYLDYDFGIGSTHYRINSWVKFSGKRLSCAESEAERKKRTLFPKEINWKPFHKEDNNLKIDIIR